MAKIPAPRKAAKPVAKKATAPKKVVATGSKKKKDIGILPGVSPWERKAIKKGQKTMSSNDKRLHEEFVQGKRDSRRILLKEGGFASPPSMSRMKKNYDRANMKPKRGEVSAASAAAAYSLGRGIMDNKIASGETKINYLKTLKKNSYKKFQSGNIKKYYKKGK